MASASVNISSTCMCPKQLILIGIFVWQTLGQAQELPTFAVHFKYKGPTPYQLTAPNEWLGRRSIERRQRWHIPYDSTDLPVAPHLLDSIRKWGGHIIGVSRWLNAALIQIDSAKAAPLQYHPLVEKVVYVRPAIPRQQMRRTSKLEIHTDIPPPVSTTYFHGWHTLNFHGGTSLHRLGYRGKRVRIAVLDAGFRGVDKMAIFTLHSNGQIIDSFDFVNRTPHVFDHHNHGTLVLSVMAANAPGVMVGTAPDAEYLLYRTENGQEEYLIEEYFWAMGAERADSMGADIINSSLGYTTFDDSTMNHSYSELDGHTTPASQAASLAARKGIIVVVSAGNWGTSPWFYISVPSDAHHILAVGAVDSNGVPAAFSGRGPTPDGRTKPEIAAYGVRVPCFVYAANTPGNARFIRASGTSLSAPIVSGLCASLLSAFNASPPSPNQFRKAIMASASLFPVMNDTIGYGIPRFGKAWGLLQGPFVFWTDSNRFGQIVGPAPATTAAIYDLTGRFIATINTRKVDNFFVGHTSIPDLAPGPYIIRTSNGLIRWWNPSR